MPGPVLVPEAVVLSAAAFWCGERPILPGASLKLYVCVYIYLSTYIYVNIYMCMSVYTCTKKLQLHMPDSKAFFIIVVSRKQFEVEQ